MTTPMNGAEPGAPKMLFHAPGATDFDVLSDGSRFLMQVEPRNPDPPIRLLMNWQSRLAAGK